jgi:NADPH-dependent ferric siderophore reductase
MPPVEERRAARSAPGMLGKAFRRMLMRQATVAACEDLGDRFRLIALEGPQLRDVAWVPGQKIQVAIGATLMTRTYTPIDWDDGAGRTRILGFAHGDAPGSAWIRQAAVGDVHDLFGPRGSIETGRTLAPLALFGDETAIGLAHALRSDLPGRILSCRFEVDRIDEVAPVVHRLGIGHARLFARTGDDRHLDAIEAELPALAAEGVTFVLSGRAPAIQRLRQALRRLGIPGGRVITKAYWAPGKSGLD